jgi:hypothetical protein
MKNFQQKNTTSNNKSFFTFIFGLIIGVVSLFIAQHIKKCNSKFNSIVTCDAEQYISYVCKFDATKIVNNNELKNNTAISLTSGNYYGGLFSANNLTNSVAVTSVVNGEWVLTPPIGIAVRSTDIWYSNIYIQNQGTYSNSKLRFTGLCETNTLASPYLVVVYIGYYPTFSVSETGRKEVVSLPLIGGQIFDISMDIPNNSTGFTQYGFRIVGKPITSKNAAIGFAKFKSIKILQ